MKAKISYVEFDRAPRDNLFDFTIRVVGVIETVARSHDRDRESQPTISRWSRYSIFHVCVDREKPGFEQQNQLRG